jgi:hypothetical protein
MVLLVVVVVVVVVVMDGHCCMNSILTNIVHILRIQARFSIIHSVQGLGYGLDSW